MSQSSSEGEGGGQEEEDDEEKDPEEKEEKEEEASEEEEEEEEEDSADDTSDDEGEEDEEVDEGHLQLFAQQMMEGEGPGGRKVPTQVPTQSGVAAHGLHLIAGRDRALAPDTRVRHGAGGLPPVPRAHRPLCRQAGDLHPLLPLALQVGQGTGGNGRSWIRSRVSNGRLGLGGHEGRRQPAGGTVSHLVCASWLARPPRLQRFADARQRIERTVLSARSVLHVRRTPRPGPEVQAEPLPILLWACLLTACRDVYATMAWDPQGVFKREMETYPFFKFQKIPHPLDHGRR